MVLNIQLCYLFTGSEKCLSDVEEYTADSDEVCEVEDDDAVHDSEEEGEQDSADGGEVWEDDMDVMHEYSEDEAATDNNMLIIAEL